jgi:hypothetical protein
MPTVVDSIPTLLHIAVFLFFVGLVDFFFSKNNVIAYITLIPIVVCVGPSLFCPYFVLTAHIAHHFLAYAGVSCNSWDLSVIMTMVCGGEYEVAWRKVEKC